MGFGAGGYRVNCIILCMYISCIQHTTRSIVNNYCLPIAKTPCGCYFWLLRNVKVRSFVLFLAAATEWIGISKRSWGACVTQLFSSVGQCVLAGTIYGIRKWRVAQLIAAAPLGVAAVYIWCVRSALQMYLTFLQYENIDSNLTLACSAEDSKVSFFQLPFNLHSIFHVIFFPFPRFIPESGRWLLNKGRTEEAKQLIAKAAAINKQPVPHSLLEKVQEPNFLIISFQ